MSDTVRMGPLRQPDAAAALIHPEWHGAPSSLAPLLDRMVLSASGWRTIFVADGDEESTSADVSPGHLVLAGLAARAFARAITATAGRPGNRPRIAVGQDTRPTGTLIAQAAIRAFIGAAIEPLYLFVTPSPEIMAFTRQRNDIDGFFYVSASHNPVGHNGLKMGGGEGSVAGGAFSAHLIDSFRELAAAEAEVRCVTDALRLAGSEIERRAYDASETLKREATRVYRGFAESVVLGPGPRAPQAFAGLRSELSQARPGIIVDMNGSARCVTMDREFLTEFGCRVHALNDIPGEIRHQIVPEGPGLAACVRALESASAADPGFILGYVPDNDGDRGNLVVAESPGTVRPLEAQEVFALAAVAELAWLEYTGTVTDAVPDAPPDAQPVAIVANGPTSMRIDRIAERFGAEVHRAEVGEANAVGLARELRESGYLVRFLGEGSNGGNITHPSTVRDPIQTVFAILKLVFAPGRTGNPSPAEIWLGPDTHGSIHPTNLSTLLGSLPTYTTTSAYDPLAIMTVRAADHAKLKETVERFWEARWPTIAARLRPIGVASYRYENYEGTACRIGKGNRTGRARGGLKILLTDSNDHARAFLWMRGSGTEPVFRVMVDVEGDRQETERYLLGILRDIVTRADEYTVANR